MKTAPVLIAVILISMVAAGSYLGWNRLAPNTASTSTIPTSNSGVTLEDLIAGKYATASDKQGTGGVTVTVMGLYVLYVRDETDGDWHVAVTDGRVPVFITEVIPRDQASEGRPSPGTTIDETGVSYCDTVHQTESWHGDTCWEIHPVTAWHLSNQSVTVTTTAASQGLNVTIYYASDPVPRGSTQTIYVGVNDSDGPIPGQAVSIHVLYASGMTTHDFACTTSADGSCSASWTIGATSTPGTFQVTVSVDGAEFYSSFEVTAG
ncbi:MAG: hypothetical protein HY296_04960 [Thaumarchaeota archaeon]|nr:hypothetical protein [Nitrososphaerota archaeon]